METRLALPAHVLTRTMGRNSLGRSEIIYVLHRDIFDWCTERCYEPRLEWRRYKEVNGWFPTPELALEFKIRWF